MKAFSVLLAVLFFAGISSSSNAGDVEINWSHPEKYTDVQPNSTSTTKKYRQRVIKELTTHLDTLAADKLPADYHLKITVTDVDLAGYIDFENGHQLRIVRDVDLPRIKLKYQLVKGDKSVGEAEANLKDMSFLRHINNKLNTTESFFYEKRLLSEWFKKTIEPLAK
ncbi:MAG TPA: DUF3016 domain-containing protein [Aeromonadales bacterium]|nr:DUF3016 domain-containing protein [Aeromonadales bacterium]